MASVHRLQRARGAPLDGPAHGCYGCRYFRQPPTGRFLGTEARPDLSGGTQMILSPKVNGSSDENVSLGAAEPGG